MDVNIPPDLIWMLVVGFIIAFALAFGIGANDVANSFGTSVGSKVLTLKQACILATVFEVLGAVLLGAKVSDTIRKGVIDITLYHNETEQLMAGNIAALSGSMVWMLGATLLRLPVSGTHSIVGAIVGFALVNHGNRGISWAKVGLIIGSWFISPLLAGLVSTGIFFFCKYFILTKEDPLEPGLRWLPAFYGSTILINLFSVFYEGPEMLHFHLIPIWGAFILSFGTAIIVAVIVRLVVVPIQRRRIQDSVEKYKLSLAESSTTKILDLVDSEEACEETSDSGDSMLPVKEPPADVAASATTEPLVVAVTNGSAAAEPASIAEDNALKEKEYLAEEIDVEAAAPVKKQGVRDLIVDRPETAHLFSFLQILTAVFGAFAHGGNDVSNAISPLITIWIVATTSTVGGTAMTPIWILIYGGFGISLGLCILGSRVIKTMGEDLTKITPSSGFCIEIGSALTVLIASNVGVPVSTTHCKVGSIVFVGRFRSRDNVDWSLFRNIVFAWVVTLPISGGISAAIMAILNLVI